MKNKTKKILAGLGFGIIGAVSLTGCTSNIAFNQDDLDKAITGINNYLETQNNYSSEFAHNTLNDLLIKASFKASKATNYIQTYTEAYRDDANNVFTSDNSITKVYYNKDTCTSKKYTTSRHHKKYEENVYNPETNTHTTKVYDLESNKWYETTSEEYVDNAYIDTLDEIINKYFIMVNDYKKLAGKIKMTKIDDNTFEFYFARHYLISPGPAYGEDEDEMMEFIENYQLRFQNGELVYINASVRCDFMFEGLQYGEMTIDWNCEDFTIDTSECTTQIDPPNN